MARDEQAIEYSKTREVLIEIPYTTSNVRNAITIEIIAAYTQGRADALKELEQLKREAFEAGQNSIVMVERIGFSDYLKQRNRDQALSELVADGEKNGDYDDQAS